jgi:hypothetical protein
MTREEMTSNGYNELKRGASYSIWVDDESGELVARVEATGVVHALEVDLYTIALAIMGDGTLLGTVKEE